MNVKRFIISFLILLPIYFLLYKIYIPRVNAFGCFDDCFNIVAGYFINEGKILYKEVFFNHQIITPFISSFIQNIANPINIFELVLRHRQFVLFFGFVFNLLLVLRFGVRIAPFIFFFEFTKFYVFGDRFLAENLVVYPLVYNFNLIWEKFNNRKIFTFDFLLAAIFTWFVIFTREPFILLSLFLFGLFLYNKNKIKIKLVSALIFLVLSFLTLSKVPILDYYFNVFTINFETFGGELNFIRVFESFFYPIYLFASSEKNIFRFLLLSLSSLFIFLTLNFLLKKKFKLIILVFLVLFLANIRSVLPGRIFYDAFHMVPWFGLFVMSIFLLVFNLKKYTFLISSILILSLLIFLPNSFLTEKIDTHKEFIVNYGNYLQVGGVIKNLAAPSDTLFVDGFDELIHWQADLPSPYKYSWYTSIMPRFEKYSDERFLMFQDNPPDFYYGSCPKEKNSFRIMPKEAMKQYQNLYSFGKPTCVFVRKEKIKEIPESNWKKVKEEFNYE